MRSGPEALAAGPALDAVHRVALLQQQFGQIAAVLPGDAGDEGGFGRGCRHGGYEGVEASAVGGQPGGEVVWTLKIEQGLGEGLELLQRERLDACGGGFAQGAAAAGEEAEGDLGGFLLASRVCLSSSWGMPGINMVPPGHLASPRQRTEQPVSMVLYVPYRTMDTLKTTSSGHWPKPCATN